MFSERLSASSGTALFYKPDDYFDVGGGWRRGPGGGPILLNLTHEVNNLLSLVGDIDARDGRDVELHREYPVEDTAAMMFSSPTVRSAPSCSPTPRRRHAVWEQTSQENTSYPTSDDEDGLSHCRDTGFAVRTHVAASRPTKPSGRGGSHSPPRPTASTRSDPLANQVTHFADVIRGEADPICSGRDGLRTMQVVDAVIQSARSGRPVDVAT